MHWHDVSFALLVGLIALGGSVFLHAALAAPVGPSAETVPLFVWNSTAVAVALVLVWRENRYGYAASILTGLPVPVSLGLIGTGPVGTIDPRGSPLWPLSYAAPPIALLGGSVAAWRETAAHRPRVSPRRRCREPDPPAVAATVPAHPVPWPVRSGDALPAGG